ncbi:MAG: hypothetical protein LBK60_04995, partial [Verrucomicrobiales bacterium]|nr:hypothetical protein [Verrucomicrobiales bacterium]
ASRPHACAVSWPAAVALKRVGRRRFAFTAGAALTPKPTLPTKPAAPANSPSVKGWPRSGRGSSAFQREEHRTLNYPVG